MRPVTHLPTCATETAGAGGLKIAETFPEGRGSPHGCGLRAVFCRDAASARPAACRDKSKGPRSGDFAGPSPGVQGAAGRPLCARHHDCHNADLTGSAICPELTPAKHSANRDISGCAAISPDGGCALPGQGSTGDLRFPGPVSAAPEGAPYPPFRRVAAAPYPARGSCGLSLIYPFARLKLPVLAASKSLRRSRKAGAARMDAG